MTDLILIRITCPTRRLADDIADASVDKRLAACANVEGPVTSTYRWKGVVEHAFEYVVWLKTTFDQWEALTALVEETHPYDLPAMSAHPVTHATDAYREWVIGAVG